MKEPGQIAFEAYVIRLASDESWNGLSSFAKETWTCVERAVRSRTGLEDNVAMIGRVDDLERRVSLLENWRHSV